jgi:hypothetical protein
MFSGSRSPVDFMSGYVDVRFKPEPAVKTFGFFPSLLSILSLALMTALSFYSVNQLSTPSAAFHRLKVVKHKTRWHTPRPTVDIESFKDFIEVIPCFFPGIAYDTQEPTDVIKDLCNLSLPSSPQCEDGKEDCIQEHTPLWIKLPFYFTIWGAGLGFVFELVLLLIGKPFMTLLNPLTTWVARVRLLNLAFVTTTVFFFAVCMTVPEDNETLLIFQMYFLVALCFALAPALFSGGYSAGGFEFMPPTLMGMQVTQFLFIVYRGAVFGGSVATNVLAAGPVLQIAALLVTTATPIRSTGFHILSTASALALYISLSLAGNESPSFSFDLEKVLLGPTTTNIWPFVVGSAIIGWKTMMSYWPTVYENFRSELSYCVWSVVYYVLVGAPSQPMPFRLGSIFADQIPEPIKLEPYSESHRYEVIPNLAIPAIRGELPQTVEANAGSLLQMVAGLFKVITRLDYFIPQADVNKSIKNKPRLSITSDGQNSYPSGLFNIGLMKEFPELGKNLQRCPEPAIDAFRDGEILAWLCQYSIGNPFLKAAEETNEYPFYKLVDDDIVNDAKTDSDKSKAMVEQEKSGFVLDFRYMEGYDYKKDYEPYGGVAFFKINKKENVLKTAWLITPREKTQIIPKEKNQAYRRAEVMINATLHFAVIAGKHLAHIHMTYNLLEVTAHNSFDVKLNQSSGQPYNAHPVRLYLYIHLFSHGLAEELTTSHLVQEGSVFSQIFAMRYESMCSFLSREYNNFEYADDENFEYREKIMQPLLGKTVSDEDGLKFGVPFSSGLEWEMQYFEIFKKYAERMTDAIYGENKEEADANVRADEALQGFYKSLELVMNKMPDRYDQFKTVKGVTRFMADSTQHLVVRHQFYGTTAVAAAMDPRIGSTEVPVDGGTMPVDEWRSLAFVALATAYANFVHIVEDTQEYTASMKFAPLQDIFDDATPIDKGGNKHALVAKMKKSWELMQTDLKDLEKKWTGVPYGNSDDGTKPNWLKDSNYMYGRPLPSSLHTGPGY